MTQQYRKRSKQIIVVASVVMLLGLMAQIPSSADPPPATGPHVIPVFHCETLGFPDGDCTFIGDFKITEGPRAFPPISEGDAGNTTLSLENTAPGGLNWTMLSGGNDGTSGAKVGLFEIFNPAALPEPGESIPIHGSGAIEIDPKHNISLGMGPYPPQNAKVTVSGGASTGVSLLVVSRGSNDLLQAVDDETGKVRFVVKRKTGNVGIDTAEANLAKLTVNGGVRIANFGPATTKHVCRNDGGPAPGEFPLLSNCSSAAEYVPTVDSGFGYPEAGDLVRVLPAVENPYKDEHSPFVVTKTNQPCDGDLLGFLLKPELGADGPKLNEHYLPLAVYGYFPAKVTMENGPIKRGDPITSSSKAGYGMKATQACKVIGYALEGADKEGTIQVFAHLSEYAAPEVAELRASNIALQAQVQELRKQLQQVLSQVQAIQARLEATPTK